MTEDKNSYRALDDIITQLEQYPNLMYVSLAGAISEPTSYPELFDLIVYLRKRNIETDIYINGDLRDDDYYRRLGVLFRQTNGGIYFTICGSTQELHSKYRVNSNLDRVLRRLDIINKWSGNRGILTWIVFNYNEQDFLNNYQAFKEKYNTEYFYTLPMSEHYQTEHRVHLPERLRKVYQSQIDRQDFTDVVCPAVKHSFLQISYDGKTYPCSMYRNHGEQHCWECSTKNLATLRNNKIFKCAEPENDVSIEPLRLYYDSPQK